MYLNNNLGKLISETNITVYTHIVGQSHLFNLNVITLFIIVKEC